MWMVKPDTISSEKPGQGAHGVMLVQRVWMNCLLSILFRCRIHSTTTVSKQSTPRGVRTTVTSRGRFHFLPLQPCRQHWEVRQHRLIWHGLRCLAQLVTASRNQTAIITV